METYEMVIGVLIGAAFLSIMAWCVTNVIQAGRDLFEHERNERRKSNGSHVFIITKATGNQRKIG